MEERKILEERLATLNGLLGPKAGNLGPAGSALGSQLKHKWDAERRLIGRILAETDGSGVRETMNALAERTIQFVSKQGSDTASWTDREGNAWQADEVINLLDDLEERLNSWLESESDLPDEEDAGDDEDNVQPGGW